MPYVRVLRDIDEVNLLTRIRLQVEHQRFAPSVLMQLVTTVVVHPSVCQHPEDSLSANGCRHALPRQRARVVPHRQVVYTCPRQHRRCDIPQLNHVVNDLAAGYPWTLHHKRNANRRLEERCLAYQVVVAQIVAMIRCQHDVGVVRNTCVLQGLQNRAHLVVDLLHQA